MTSYRTSLATASFGAIVLLAAPPALAGDAGTHRVAPLKGVSFDIGAKHAVTYFENEKGVCQVTLLIAERPDSDAVLPDSGARVRVTVDAGKTARLDTAQGKSIDLACAEGASAMEIRPVQQVAWSAAQK